MNILRNFTQQQSNNPEVMKKTAHDATLHNVIDPDNRPVFEMPPQATEEKPEGKRCQLTKKHKIIIGALAFLIVAGLALGLGLGLTLTRVEVTTGPIEMVQSTDGSGLIVSNLQIQYVSRRAARLPRGFDFGIQGGFRVSAPLQSTLSGRNLQERESNSEYTVVADFDNMGVMMSVNSSTDATTITVQPDTFFEYLENLVPASQRLLAETDEPEITINQMKEELGQLIRQHFDVQSTVHFEQTILDTWVHNQTTGNFQLENETSTQNLRLLGWKKWEKRIWNKVKPLIVPTVIAVAKPAVQQIKDNKKQIETAVEKIKDEAKKVAKPQKPAPKIPLPAQKLKKCLPKGNRRVGCPRKVKENSKEENEKNKVIQTTI